ncbi:IS3 family transposase [Corynebacterium accolens]|uniref:IS3 family transposase n=1 Tax=Corynebacterium accolens TaxID=38284 RepID=UPI00266F9EF7|nr:IS3 family transposase [Corynebacterium accolens]WKS65969.1 IS3 family transposase [Corynebacterium accolens]
MTAAIDSDPVNDRGKGGRLNHKRTARLMRQMGLFGFTRKRRVKTTTSSQVCGFTPVLRRVLLALLIHNEHPLLRTQDPHK